MKSNKNLRLNKTYLKYFCQKKNNSIYNPSTKFKNFH